MAADSVAPPSVIPQMPISPSSDSASGQTYLTENGTKQVNLGQKKLNFITHDLQEQSMTYQMTDVTRPLNFIPRILDSRNLRGVLPRWRLGGKEVDWTTAQQTTTGLRCALISSSGTNHRGDTGLADAESRWKEAKCVQETAGCGAGASGQLDVQCIQSLDRRH